MFCSCLLSVVTFDRAKPRTDVQHEEAMQHAQRRISDLLHKADAVDKVEHERVVTALKAAQDQLATVQTQAKFVKPLQASVNRLAEEAEAMQAKYATVQVITQPVSLCISICNFGTAIQ